MPIATEIYYHRYQGGEQAENPAVVLIHGAGGTHLYWPSQIRRLPGYDVLAVDLPGHGKSAGRGLQSISAYTEALLAWLEAAGLHSAVFIGHSMGSAIALSLALDHPEHVLGLGLLGAAARMPVSPAILESTATQTTFHRAVAMVVKLSFSPQAPERLVELATQRMAETRPSVLHGDFLACDAFDVTARLSEIRQPTIVISGAKDRMTPARNAQYLANEIPNASFSIVEDAGHMVMLEEPDLVADLLLGFLEPIQHP